MVRSKNKKKESQMAMQADSPAGTPSAQFVGNAFVEQYYQVLHQSPELVFRFYQDSSVLSRPDANGVMTSVTTTQGINEKILSLNCKDYMAEIKTADAQLSFKEGEIVLVTGCLTGKDNLRKKFAHTFFLAPQDEGYFVLNDVFRYIEENEQVERTPVSTSALGESAPATAPVPDPAPPAHVPEDPILVPETSEEDPNNGAEVCDPSYNDGSSVEDEVVAEPPASSQTEHVALELPSSVPEGDAPNASTVKYRKANSTPAKAHVSTPNTRAPPSNSEKKSHEPVKTDPVPEPIVSAVETAPENNNVHDEEGHSIYVRNLPLNATSAQLEQVFREFGSIKQDGVQVRSNKQGFCYGFVEFKSVESMTSALEASPVMIGNRKAVIEEKRTTTRVGQNTNGGGGRKSYPPGGRGGGFRSHSFRGRSGGPRSYGRGEYVPPTHVPEDPVLVPDTSEQDPNNGAEVCDPSDNDGSAVEDEFVAEPPASSQTEHVAVESPSSVPECDAPNASIASPVMIGNRKAVVEEKRTTTPVGQNTNGGGGRKRYPPGGRGGGFRSHSFRGRSGGPRSYGQGEYVPPTHVPEDPVLVPETSEQDPNNGAEVCDPSDNDGSAVEDEFVAEPPASSQTEHVAVGSPSSVPEGDASNASIVKYRKTNQAHVSTPNIRLPPSNSEKKSREPVKTDPVPEPTVSAVETAPETNNVHDEAAATKAPWRTWQSQWRSLRNCGTLKFMTSKIGL